jgi:hypothetical protein
MTTIRFDKTAPTSARKFKEALGRLAVEHSSTAGKSVTGKFFVDGTKDASVSHHAGVTFVIIDNNEGLLRSEPAEGVVLQDVNLFFDTLNKMRAQKPRATLPPAEAAMFDKAGFVDNPLVATFVMEQSKRELDEILGDKGSLSLNEAAAALGVSTSRIRQKLGAERTLYGVKLGRTWRVPLFQFEPPKEGTKKGGKRTQPRKLVHNIEKVMPTVNRELSALSVRRFFQSENSDLVVGDEETPVSPLAWLSAGNPPDPVVAIAAEL